MRLYQPTHIIVATPGRILDLSQKGVCKLNACRVLVMDEVRRRALLRGVCVCGVGWGVGWGGSGPRATAPRAALARWWVCVARGAAAWAVGCCAACPRCV